LEASPAQEIWEAALGELQLQVSKPNYRTWLQKTTGLSYQDHQFVVSVPNAFVAEYLDMNQRSLIEKTLIGIIKDDISVRFHVNGKLLNTSGGSDIAAVAYPAALRTLPKFNAKYTFDSFIVGDNNHLAHDAALHVANNPGHSYNPLFIYGGVGLGKTHLLQAIGHFALAKNLLVLFVSAEQFTNELVTAIRDRKTEDFRNKYRNADMLLIDDIQFIGGKEQTEQSFFHTFDELRNANHPIAITCDCPPKSMPLLQERLRSRFEWGLVVDIQPPEFETRLAILQAKAKDKGVDIAPDTLELIAMQAPQNVRELEGSLNRVIAYSRLVREPLTPELTAKALENIAGKTANKASITPSLIIEAAASSYHLNPSDLKGRKRDKETSLARHIAMYLMRDYTNFSLAKIGRELGGRDTSTVIHACEKISRDMAANPSLRRIILDIKRTCLKQRGNNPY